MAESDTTFRAHDVDGRPAWVGRCLHCRGKLVVWADGTAPVSTTLEHIVPKHRGGGDDLDNLGLACRRCNHLKGARIDRLPENHPAYVRTIARLLSERRRRRPAPPPAAPKDPGH